VANRGLGRPGGAGGGASAGQGGAPTGSAGTALPGTAGAAGAPGVGFGGGLEDFSSANVRIDNTTIAGNSADTGDNDVSGRSLE
jgi:hypothetical protein